MSRGSAERQRRYRERQRNGVLCVVPVPVYTADVTRLVESGRLHANEGSDRARIVAAIGLLVDDFTKNWLVGSARSA